jgi:hypothetical protein
MFLESTLWSVLSVSIDAVGSFEKRFCKLKIHGKWEKTRQVGSEFRHGIEGPESLGKTFNRTPSFQLDGTGAGLQNSLLWLWQR